MTTDWARELSDRDLVSLRALRTDVQRLIAGAAAARRTGRPRLRLVLASGRRAAPRTRRARVSRFAAEVWTQVFLAQQAETWKRLKLCHNPPCASAFYDRSKNNSGVWHDVKMCGNAVNLRASRARRRVATAQPEQP